ncbi:MAG: thioesterase family protein [Gammaproteobacteria bacterium]
MNQFEQFQKVLELEQKTENIFCFKPNTNYFVGQTPHGGYLMAMMHKALVSVLPHSTAINSNVLYLDRTEADLVELHVDTFKLGKGSSSGQVKLIQDGRINCTFTAICSDLDKLEGYSDMPSPLPNTFYNCPASEFITMNYDNIQKGFTPSFIQQLNLTVHPEHSWWLKTDFDRSGEARCSGYLELEGGIADQFALSYFSDILPPVVTNKYGPIGWIPTLTLTTNIRQLPLTEKLFIDGVAKDLNNGFFEQDCSIWDLNGNLVATSRQIAKILKSKEKLER